MTKAIHGRFPVILIVLVFVASACITADRDAFAGAKEAVKFYLVGVGPGDPDLITLRALRVIGEADVIVCTKTPQTSKHKLGAYFAFEEKFAPYLEGKELVHTDWFLGRYYGEDPSELRAEERRKCDEIARERNDVIARLRQAVKAGKTVAVLSKGDPLIYGPHAWYLEEFEDLNPVVVPGLSSFNAANAALRKGVTTSDRTKSVILTAGYGTSEKTDTIEKLSVHGCTMVIFTMGVEFPECIKKLSLNYPAETPVAIVKHAGYAEKEEVIQGTLGTIVDQIGSETPPFEYLIYVGDFLAHRHKKPDKPEKD